MHTFGRRGLKCFCTGFAKLDGPWQLLRQFVLEITAKTCILSNYGLENL